MLKRYTVLVALSAVAFYSAFLFNSLRTHGFDPATFVVAGDQFVDPSLAPSALTVTRGVSGYDGQFLYRLALTPFTTQRDDRGIRLDMPAYRQQRILYPLLVHLVSLGDPRAALWAMIGVNLAALFAVALLGAHLARSCTLSPWWGLAFVAYPGFVVSLSRDLSEIVAAACVLGGLLALRRNRSLLAGVTFALAVLARETTLIVPASVGLAAMWNRYVQRQSRPLEAAVWVPALLTFLVAQATLAAVWGTVPALSVKATTFPPFSGFMESIWRDLHNPNALTQQWVAVRLFFVVFAALVFWPARTPRDVARPAYEHTAFVLYAVLASLLGTVVWCEDKAFLRALTELYLLGTLILFTHSAERRWFAVGGWLALLYMTLRLGGFWN